jgi:HTH-type transcriptional regulator/antitoxin HigA
MADLRAELVDYEHLRSRSIEALPLKSLNDLPAVLVQARIARGWSQRQLAEALHVKPQQVQRDERDGYRRATLERLVKTAEVLGLRVDTEVRLTLTA